MTKTNMCAMTYRFQLCASNCTICAGTWHDCVSRDMLKYPQSNFMSKGPQMVSVSCLCPLQRDISWVQVRQKICSYVMHQKPVMSLWKNKSSCPRVFFFFFRNWKVEMVHSHRQADRHELQHTNFTELSM